MLFFGFVQVVMSQIPNFRDTEWLSIVASIMSFSYSIIGSALGLAKVIGMVNYMLCKLDRTPKLSKEYYMPCKCITAVGRVDEMTG